MTTRRDILKYLGSTTAMLYFSTITGCGTSESSKSFSPQTGADIFKATNGDPRRATRDMLAALGGIESLIDKNDIVVLKPNSQWWHQGMTNTDVMSEFITAVLEIPGFDGEIIIADNNQSTAEDFRGWSTDMRNGRFNYNELVDYFNEKGHANVSKYRWNPAGPNPTPLQFAGFGDAVRKHPSEGDGYIWPKDLFYTCPHGNKCILAYPVFTSRYSGITIDLKDGALREGEYTGQPVKFINFSAINHHGPYVGVTASIKNYMGVVDMSCGYPAPFPENTFNTHHVGASGLFRWMARHRRTLRKLPGFGEIYQHPSVFRFRYTGGVLGAFMKYIRPSDLHIITAIRVGWGSRTDTSMASQPNTVVASNDPVALDYWSCKNILLPATIKAGAPEYYRKLNDPDREDGVLRMFLEECRRELGGTIDPEKIKIISS